MYAQVLLKHGNIVGLIGGEAEGLPIVHPDVLCIDIEDRTDVKVGMQYNSETRLFYEEEPEAITPQEPESTTAEYLVDLDFRLSNIELGI